MRLVLDGAARTPLSVLRGAIERAIPLPAGGKNNRVVATAQPRVDELTRSAEEAGFDPSAYVNWLGSLGSLGSGF